ncbi:MAG TPA: four helix bundle protein [Cytophagaceae bacterium]|jgi:four helix bundle protein|nr:four helix bundle protein [Cytophagaceae bacterium]
MEVKSYTDLKVWQEARTMVKRIYSISQGFPKEEIYGLQQQVRRCAVSVPSNIAEGIGRNHNKDTVQFLYVAKGSLYEMETQLYLAMDLNYIQEKTLSEALNHVISIRKLLLGFIKYKISKTIVPQHSAPSTQH